MSRASLKAIGFLNRVCGYVRTGEKDIRRYCVEGNSFENGEKNVSFPNENR